MSGSPADSAPSQPLSRRRRRALGVAALALVVVAAAAFGYLHSTTAVTPKQTMGLTSTNPPPASLSPFFYSFATASLGWAVENPGGQFHVFSTKDGAKHWHEQLTGKSGSPGFSGVGLCCRPPITVHFYDKTHGCMIVDLAFGDEHAYLTSDGGDHWQAVRLPAPQGVVVTFGNASYGWALAPVSPEQAQPVMLHATSDGGAAWQPRPDPPRDAYYLAFNGPTEGWMGSLSPSDPPHVYSTSDAGNSWQRHDLPPPPGRTWNTRFSGTTVQLLQQFGAVATTDSGDRFTSFDKGGTWTYVPPSPGDVGYQDAFHWWAINGTFLFKSSDGGQTWSLTTDSLPNWKFLGSPLVLDSTHAWAVTFAGRVGLALTIDGGLHWTPANVPRP